MPHDGPTPTERARRREHRRGPAAKIEGDPEVRAFIAERIGDHTFDQLADAARAAFGARRAPSRSTIHRWWIASRRRAATVARDTRGDGACPWCDRRFAPVRRGPHVKRFCGAACRAAFHAACMRYGARLFDAGLITADDLSRVATGRQRVVNDGETPSGGAAPASSRTATTKETS